MEKGLVQVYTGDGKGKTTAALGLALRAVGRGLKVLMLQFMKDKGYGEHEAARRLAPDFELEWVGKPFFVAREGELSAEALAALGKENVWVFPPGEPPPFYVSLMQEGLARARQALTSGKYDLVILDEINVALFYGLVSYAEVSSLLAQRLPTVEVVLTGRGAPPELIAQADLVTEMREVKHYYQKGILSRPGIDN